MVIVRAEEGMVYHNKNNGAIVKILMLGRGDTLDNYELISEPIPEPDIPIEEEPTEEDYIEAAKILLGEDE